MIYPNPAGDVLNVRAENIFESCTITNNIGKTVLSAPINEAKNQVNIKSLPAGLYYINLKGGTGNETRKFVKM